MKRTRDLLAWILVAVGLYLSRRREMRRAALRGVLGAAASSVPAIVADREAAGVAARAASFATGAAIESRAAGAVSAAVGVVTFARAVRHDPSGAIAGAAAGVGAAIASVRVWPVPPPLGPAAPRVRLPERLEPSPGGGGLTIVINTASGGGGDGLADDLRQALPDAKLEEVDPVEGHELRAALERAVEEGATALGVAGGDGSINTAAQVALEHERPLMVVPSGTFNHLTGAIGIETLEDAVAAVRAGEVVGIDVASLGDHVFLNTASFGSYVELVDARRRLEERIGKWPAVVVALVRVLRRSRPVRVEVDGRACSIWMAFIGNCRYHPSGFAPTWRDRLDDGILDVRYVDGTEPWARTRLVAAVVTGRLGRSRVYRESHVSRVRLTATDGPLRLARDGETFEAPDEVVVCKRDRRLTVFAPHRRNA